MFPEQTRGEELPAWTGFLPNAPFDMMARHSIDFWLQSEDLPHPDNRVSIDREGRVILDIAENNREAHRRLRAKVHLTEGGGQALATALIHRRHARHLGSG